MSLPFSQKRKLCFVKEWIHHNEERDGVISIREKRDHEATRQKHSEFSRGVDKNSCTLQEFVAHPTCGHNKSLLLLRIF